MTDIFKSRQSELLSPNQWADQCPEPEKVLRLTTKGRVPVDARVDLWIVDTNISTRPRGFKLKLTIVVTTYSMVTFDWLHP